MLDSNWLNVSKGLEMLLVAFHIVVPLDPSLALTPLLSEKEYNPPCP